MAPQHASPPGSGGVERLSIAPPHGTQEREADDVAARALARDTPLPVRAPLPIRAPVAPLSAARETPPLTGRGQPLDPGIRRAMEPPVGFDFSRVRIHADDEAAASARAVGARAYAVGAHIVFGRGEYAPMSGPGRRLLAHELAHVGLHGGDGRLHRKPAATTRSWAEIWMEFDAARKTDPRQATALARTLAATPPGPDDLLEHGMELVAWLDTHGDPATAQRVLADVRQRFKAGGRSTGKRLNIFGSSLASQTQLDPAIDPRILIDRARDAARAGQHERARQFLGVANEILWTYVRETSSQQTFGIPALTTYPQLRVLYERLREVYRMYPELQEEARRKGDARGVHEATHAGAEFRRALDAEFTPAGEAELAELRMIRTRRGDALQLIGANDQTENLTQLPGLDAPGEMVSKSGGATQVEQIATLQTAFLNQDDLQAELRREPDIQRAFPSGPIDLHDTATRQRVWQIMYGVYKRSSLTPLQPLMALIGRYLKAYTHHTTYNIRDFGKNYVDSDFPVNLAGQVERDCGVYALTVAWDVFQTAQHADADLEVEFSLRVMLDHIILVIDDLTSGQSYVVSNDRITRVDPTLLAHPPQSRDTGRYDEADSDVRQRQYIRGDVGAAVAREYASVRNLPFIVSPEIKVDLGSTRTKERAFHDALWSKYQSATGHASSVTAAVDARLATINAKLPGGRGAVAGVFEAQEGLNNALKDLDTRLDAMEQLSGAALTKAVDDELTAAVALFTLFEIIGRADKGPAPDRPVQVGLGRGVHPLVRFAALIQRVQAAGGVLTTTFRGVKDGKPAELTATDFVQHCRALFGAP